jgi:hypothetical protein
VCAMSGGSLRFAGGDAVIDAKAAQPWGQDWSYCGSYVSFTMLEKDFVAVSFIAAA